MSHEPIPTADRIMHWMHHRGEPLSVAQIAGELEMTPGAVRRCLSRLEDAERVAKETRQLEGMRFGAPCIETYWTLTENAFPAKRANPGKASKELRTRLAGMPEIERAWRGMP